MVVSAVALERNAAHDFADAVHLRNAAPLIGAELDARNIAHSTGVPEALVLNHGGEIVDAPQRAAAAWRAVRSRYHYRGDRRAAEHRLPRLQRHKHTNRDLVDDRMKTNVAVIYAAGDCVEAIEFSTGTRFVHAIQPNAADQARIAAMNMSGRPTHSPG